ncbi:MAG TPA: hypothetical protein VLR91_01990 [Thermodesulfobacteriota bacterium]|nr:hypothetical protein [Thermodesulfobacteriota bacterium]
MDELFFVGQDIPRVDARGKVTGEALYTVDISFLNMLWGLMLKARILNMDSRRAERLPGGKALRDPAGGPHLSGAPQLRGHHRHSGCPGLGCL